LEAGVENDGSIAAETVLERGVGGDGVWLSGECLAQLGGDRGDLVEEDAVDLGHAGGAIDAVASDHVESLWRDVEEIAPDELARGETHHLG